MVNEARGKEAQAVVSENLATSNANVFVRNVAGLGTAGAHA
jgi:hypothetical protein